MRGFFLLTTALVTSVAAGQAVAEDADVVNLDTVVVRSEPLQRDLGETILGASVLEAEELAQHVSGSIGETLRHEPGVSSTFFGPGASRPVIRGLGGDRIRVLDSGIGSIDASAASPDHAVAVEPALADRIEILRGTAMLLYGSSASGGVVNVFDGRIPDTVPEDGFDVGGRFAVSTVDDSEEFAGAANIAMSAGEGDIVLHLDGFWREADDYDIPGFAESAAFIAAEEAEEEEHGHEEHGHEEEEEVFGVAENSDIDSQGGSIGASYVFDNGFFGISARVVDSEYGLPGGHAHEEEEHHEGEEEHEEEEHGEEGVRINLDQARYDFRGEIEGDFLFAQKINVRAGYANYKHKELESPEEVGTVFSNEGWEGRVELVNKPIGDVDGAIGFQIRTREFSALGAEAFVPETDTLQYGFFSVNELERGAWHFDFGGRVERTKHEVTGTSIEREFTGVSLSAGLGRDLTEEVFAGLTVYRTERAPSTEELFSNGPHLATNAFEIGDPDLDKEKALGVEGTVRGGDEQLTFALNMFYTNYSDFIYETATGAEEDGLPVLAFRAEDARFYGMEFETAANLGEWKGLAFQADASVSLVKAKLDVAGNDNLPRIPPLSSIMGLEASNGYLTLRAEGEFAGEQDDVTAFELPTDDYALFNAYLELRPFAERQDIALEIRGSNLTDEEARLHTSFIKDLIPLPGRNIRVAIRGRF